MPLSTRSGLVLLTLIMGLFWIGTPPSQAAGESWSVVSVDDVGCGDADWDLTIDLSGLDGAPGYRAHTTVTAGGLTYMNEDVPVTNNGLDGWGLYSNFSYGAVATPGTYPIPAGQEMTVELDLERPKGTVLSSWRLVAASCDSATLLYNGPTAADLDHDFVATPTDMCPSITSFTANGCPLRDRVVTLRARYGPRRVVGKLYAAGHPDLDAGRTVQIWKKRPGPDKLVATRTTNSLGMFKAKVDKGRYYATSPDFIAPVSGQALADVSNRVRVR